MGVIDTLKGLSNMVKEIGDIELNRQIIDLQNEVFELIEENHQLKMDKEKNEKIEQINKDIVFEGNYYYFKTDKEKENAYCSACWDNDNKLIRTHTLHYGQGVKVYRCPVCNN